MRAKLYDIYNPKGILIKEKAKHGDLVNILEMNTQTLRLKIEDLEVNQAKVVKGYTIRRVEDVTIWDDWDKTVMMLRIARAKV